MECLCFLRNIQDKQTGRKAPYERRFGTLFDGAVIPFGAEMVDPISTKDNSRLHQLGNNMLCGIYMWYALHTGGKSSGDLLIADWDEPEKNIASEVHVERFESQEVVMKNLQEVFLFFAQTIP